jgi:transcriptional regulator with XRE-family HTH domain
MANSRTPARVASRANPPIDGALLRERRQLAGLSITDLAAKIGVSVSYISAIERGARPTVSPAMFGRICDAMGITDRTELLRRSVA